MTIFVGYSVFMRLMKVFLLFLTSSLLCFLLHQQTFMNAVMASSVVGLLGVALTRYFSSKEFELIVYCGSFAGMSSGVYFSAWWMFPLSAAIGSILYILLENYFNGWGGKLGAMAFLSLVIFLL